MILQRLIRHIAFLVVLMCTLGSFAREVDSPEDLLRVEDFPKYKADIEAWNRLRLSDLQDQFKKMHEWEEEQKKSLLLFKAEKNQHMEIVNESGPAYNEFLRERNGRGQVIETGRIQYVHLRDDERARSKRSLNIAEETELGIYQLGERVEWKKRRFFSSPSEKGFASAGGSDFPPPPPPPPPPNYFDAPPPPPQPPMNGYDQNYYEEPIPPPPPIYDENQINY